MISFKKNQTKLEDHVEKCLDSVQNAKFEYQKIQEKIQYRPINRLGLIAVVQAGMHMQGMAHM